jgi:hypothetical protein
MPSNSQCVLERIEARDLVDIGAVLRHDASRGNRHVFRGTVWSRYVRELGRVSAERRNHFR